MNLLAFSLPILIINTSFPQEENPFQGAQVLIDPRMRDAVVNNEYFSNRKDAWNKERPHHIHTLFRRSFDLDSSPSEAKIYITADDYFVLYINGVRVLEGPPTGYPFAYPYCEFNVKPYLSKGKNLLAVHTYYRGLVNRVTVSGDNRSGLILRLVVRGEDGKEFTINSDENWKCLPLEVYLPSTPVGYKTQFIENIDMRKYPHDWYKVDYDDSFWITPSKREHDYKFVRIDVKPVFTSNIFPVSCRIVDKGVYFYDFGRETVGYTRIKIKGEEGQKVVVYHGEELEENGRVRWKMRANCDYREEITLSGREEIIPFFEYKAFRYVEVEGAPESLEVWVEERHYPFDLSRHYFQSSDESLCKIWNICVNGVRLCSQEGFLDCPSREKAQYLGDAVIISRSFLWLTGDTSLAMKSLFDFCVSSEIDKGLTAVAPSGFIQEFAEYSLQYPLMLWEYYRHSGDKEFLRSAVDRCLLEFLQYFERFEGEDGLLWSTGPKPILIDWPKNLRDNFDYEYALDKPNAVVNAFYYGAITTTLRIFGEVGINTEKLKEKAEKIFVSYQNIFLDREKNLYRDALNSSHCSLHSNALSLYFGLVKDEEVKKAIFEFIESKGLSCGVYIASYVIEACFREGNPELGWKLLTNNSEYSWKEMLRNGATACLEVWKPEMKMNMSWCHAWSSSPIYLVYEYVAGLKPALPGWKEIEISPVKLNDLPEMFLIKTFPNESYCSVHIKDGVYVYNLPLSLKCSYLVPDGQKIIINKRNSCDKLPSMTNEEKKVIEKNRWREFVGDSKWVWVSVANQKLRLLQGECVVWETSCSTSARGIGEVINSEKTPRGWHVIVEKIGEGAPIGQIFRSRKPEGVWDERMDINENLILTRILRLQGVEEGVNRGVNSEGEVVDSYMRYIYIHGTNKENEIGKPTSKGCVCLTNYDMVYLFNCVEIGTKVLITEE
ncbi:MAG: family 78 glycoside hydrolase catalytic domain [Candidatus Hydrogenedentes bacterium]|nr:family 78 glycoside hydrolase catalytic domain [Candidatus Hydrogenedentota bacterium]